MSAFLYPVLNGIAPSWADIVVRGSGDSMNLIEMGDIAAISSGFTVEVGEQREGGRVIQRTTGSLSQEASWTLYASGYQKLLRALVQQAPRNAKGQARLSLAHFLVHYMWTPPGADTILEVKLKGCRILGRTLDASEGTDAQQVEVPLSPLEVVDIIDGVECVGL